MATTFAAGLVGALGASNAGAEGQAAAEQQGCPSGAVCIYPEGKGWNGGHPSDVYESYGAHNITGQTGVHRIYNNQTGGATMSTCTGANGTGCEGRLPANNYIDKNMTPINSITLQP